MKNTTFKNIQTKTNKKIILKFIKNKAGIYKFTNTKNNKSYIGSSKDLYSRFLKHLNINNNKRQLLKNNCLICQAFIEEGYDKFTLEILEFIQLDNKNPVKTNTQIILNREQYHLDQHKPEYNIIKAKAEVIKRKISNKA
jgi:group I intron endonuclease